MDNLCLNIALPELHNLNLVLLFGIIIITGTFAARICQKLHVPQVIGCILCGILLGDVLNLITDHTIETLKPFTMFALGIIGFQIGGELKGSVFKKYGRQFFIILFAQGIGAFLLVAVAAAAASFYFTDDILKSISIGLVLGAIASATAPAATVNVLWEYKTRGPLTIAVLAIVALDDALALLLYRIAATITQAITGTGHDSVLASIAILFAEIAGAVLTGLLAAIVLVALLKFVRSDEKILAFSISALLIVVGISIIPDIDPILPAMVLGITVANLSPRQSKSIFSLIKKFTPPIYTSFFVLAGAHMQFSKLTKWIVVMIAVFTIFRCIGKIAGSYFGAVFAKSPEVVRKYLGICLLPQAGVAIGLAILASNQFNSEIGQSIIMIVMTATFIMEIVGPIMVKIGVKRAGEVGLNITEEDLIKSFQVKDIKDDNPTTITQDLDLRQILDIFSKTDIIYYPVIDSDEKLVGAITIPGIKEMFASQDVASWLLACDVCEPVLDTTTPDKPLEEVLEYMQKFDLQHIPVVETADTKKLVGLIDYRKTRRKISAEILHRREKADSATV